MQDQELGELKRNKCGTVWHSDSNVHERGRLPLFPIIFSTFEVLEAGQWSPFAQNIKLCKRSKEAVFLGAGEL